MSTAFVNRSLQPRMSINIYITQNANTRGTHHPGASMDPHPDETNSYSGHANQKLKCRHINHVSLRTYVSRGIKPYNLHDDRHNVDNHSYLTLDDSHTFRQHRLTDRATNNHDERDDANYDFNCT